MKLRKLLCRSAAALIAVSVPLVGMNAFGEAGAPAATPTGTVETEEAAEPESHALSEDEIAHQKYLCRYDFVEADGYFKMDSVNLDELWDFDELNIRPHYLDKSDQVPGKLYLSSKTGAWENILLKELFLKDNSESVTMGSTRDAIPLSLDLSNAYLKLVRNDNKTKGIFGLKINSSLDDHRYDEFITETNEDGNTVYKLLRTFFFHHHQRK